jgi:hypothetical protein
MAMVVGSEGGLGSLMGMQAGWGDADVVLAGTAAMPSRRP